MEGDQHGSPEDTSGISGKIVTQKDDGIKNTGDMEPAVAAEEGSFKTPVSIKTTTQDEDNFKVPVNFPFKKPVFIKRTQRLNTKQEERKSKSEEKLEEGRNIVSEASGIPKSTKTPPALPAVEKKVPVPYTEPSWSGLPAAEYSFEVIKNGTIVDVIPLNKPFLVVGRLAQCDIIMEHPSLSRFHCVIQYCLEGSEAYPQGFYAYDLCSSHGSFHNKHLMKPRTYYHLRVGHILKFGGSTRMLILQGPEEDQEPELELSVTELKARSAEHARKLEQLETGEVEDDQEQRMKEETTENHKTQEDSRGIDWGMGEDAEDEEEEDEEQNPFASLNEELYLEDPKKTLRGWFEREGYDPPNYVTEDVSAGFYKCKLELPVPGPGGGPLVATVEHKGKKKEAVIQCALEACRLLDRVGVLRQAKHESHERKRRDWAENDYYDSDEDDFLDRTGDVQRKRIRRMKEAGGKDSGFVENYDTLMTKYKEVTKELENLEGKLAEADYLKQASESSRGAEDDLDTYMHKLKSQVPDKHKRVAWKLRAVELRKDELRLRRLTNIARPLGVPELQAYQSKYGTSSIKQNLKVEPVGEKQKGIQKTMFGATQPKESSLRVHKIFLEDEPERKPRLRRLDDDDDELPSSLHPRIPHRVKLVGQYATYDSVKEIPEMIAPGSSKSKDQVQKHKHSPLQSFEDDKHSVSGSKTVKRPGMPLQKSKQIVADKQSGNDARDSESGENLVCKRVITQEMSACNEKTETNGSSNDTHEWKRPITPENSLKKYSSSKGTDDCTSEKRQRFVGPALPPNLAQLRTGQQDHTRTKKKQEKRNRKYDDDSPNYDTWIPPQQQTGDGRTSLNDKLGY
ncbi:kanadaptin [Panulirus ornatus]|uniref:kanadaptin n=1 Tax=Panulirus ornatus TaxID=150431 RepID=UPI003A84AD2A